MKYLVLILTFTSVQLIAQQEPDLDFPITVENPTYADGETVLIGIDASHNNLHTLKTNFAPFAKLLKEDGYQPISIDEVTKENLENLTVFVVANALHTSNIENWRRPVANAFSDHEIDIIEDWVESGGSLLVIADHMPFAGASNELAARFGFSYVDGFVLAKDQVWPPDTYSKEAGNLLETPITAGIDSIIGFTGSAVLPPQDATVIAKFPETHQILVSEVAWQFDEDTEIQAIGNTVMGAVTNFRKGRVAFFSEAAMFTAQIVQDRYKVGFNSPAAPQNMQFVLNTIHWLDSEVEKKMK